MAKVALVVPENKKAKERVVYYDQELAEKILKKKHGHFLPKDSKYKFDGNALVVKAKPKEEEGKKIQKKETNNT